MISWFLFIYCLWFSVYLSIVHLLLFIYFAIFSFINHFLFALVPFLFSTILLRLFSLFIFSFFIFPFVIFMYFFLFFLSFSNSYFLLTFFMEVRIKCLKCKFRVAGNRLRSSTVSVDKIQKFFNSDRTCRVLVDFSLFIYIESCV